MKFAVILSAAIIAMLLISPTDAQTLTDAIIAADGEAYLSLPEPPVGMSLIKTPLTVDDRLLGFQLVLSQEELISKVMIKIELTDRSKENARTAAFKGYVNGMVDGLKQSGLTIDPSSVPDFTTLDLKKPIDLDLVFTNKEGGKLFVWKRIFFTSKGFDISVIAVNKDDVDRLSAWAKKIRPVVAK